MGTDLTLYKMFGKIRAQQNMRGIIYQDMTADQKLHYANECVLALSVEVSELASSWPFASWKTTKIDIDNIEREIIDCFFFLSNIADCFNITTEDLAKRFEAVLENNQRRINDGTHKTMRL